MYASRNVFLLFPAFAYIDPASCSSQHSLTELASLTSFTEPKEQTQTQKPGLSVKKSVVRKAVIMYKYKASR